MVIRLWVALIFFFVPLHTFWIFHSVHFTKDFEGIFGNVFGWVGPLSVCVWTEICREPAGQLQGHLEPPSWDCPSSPDWNSSRNQPCQQTSDEQVCSSQGDHMSPCHSCLHGSLYCCSVSQCRVGGWHTGWPWASMGHHVLEGDRGWEWNRTRTLGMFGKGLSIFQCLFFSYYFFPHTLIEEQKTILLLLLLILLLLVGIVQSSCPALSVHRCSAQWKPGEVTEPHSPVKWGCPHHATVREIQCWAKKRGECINKCSTNGMTWQDQSSFPN